MGGVYKRSNWNELIDRVNDVLQNPPTGTDCEPIDPVEHVGSSHIWTKRDIQGVEDAIAQTCPDISFDAIPELWQQSIIDDINAALDQAWCDCENEEECWTECEGAGDVQTMEFVTDAVGCDPSLYLGMDVAAQNLIDEATSHGSAAGQALETYTTKWNLYCYNKWPLDHCLTPKLERLQALLERQEATAATECAKPDNEAACTAAQQKVDETQAKIDETQQQIDDLQAQLDEYLADANAAKNTCNTEAAICWSMLQTLQVCLDSQNLCHYIQPRPWPECDCDWFPSWVSYYDPGQCRYVWKIVLYREVYHYPTHDTVYPMNYIIGLGAFSPDGTPFCGSNQLARMAWCNKACVSDEEACATWARDCQPTQTYYFRVTVTGPELRGEDCRSGRHCPQD